MNFNEEFENLEERIIKYDSWVSEGKIPASSKVIPINEALNTLEWILPTNQVIEILRNSRSVALQNCDCRTKNKKCDNPIDVCFLINDTADKNVQNGKARYIKMDEAIEKLKLANEYGLVHLTIYNPDQHIFALCSCCECCCHDLQIMKKYSRTDFIAHSDYIAEMNTSSCKNCGKCIERCRFGAYEKNDIIVYNSKRCYGCGLCVTSCPTNSIILKLRNFGKR